MRPQERTQRNPRIRARLLFGGWLLVALAACAPAHRFEAASGGTAERARVGDFSLTASVHAWPGNSQQLPDGVFPIWVRIRNQASEPVRVTYEDFGAETEEGNTFGVIDPATGHVVLPATVAPEPSPNAGVGRLSPSLRYPLRPSSAWEEGDVAGTIQTDWTALDCERSSQCANVALLPVWGDETPPPEIELVRQPIAPARRGFSGPPRSSSYGYWGASGYYGGYWGYPYYGYPYYYDPYGYRGYYGAWGWGWPYYGSGYYLPYYGYGYERRPRREHVATTATMSRVALAEGELKAGATRAGFVYLPRLARTAKRLELTWAVHSTLDEPLVEVAVRFLAVADE